jgi:mannitol/fructose-specific phosphotransferase system IIA component (Ntr-type)
MNQQIEDKTTNLAELANKLEEAKRAIPESEKKLQGREKSSENYLILENKTIAEMDKGEQDGRVTVHETIG